MSDNAPALDINQLNTEVAGKVSSTWVDQNLACPYAQAGERIFFATPRPQDEHAALRASIEETLGANNFGVQTIPHPRFTQLVEKLRSHFSNSLEGASMPSESVGEIIAKAGAKADSDAEALRR